MSIYREHLPTYLLAAAFLLWTAVAPLRLAVAAVEEEAARPASAVKTAPLPDGALPLPDGSVVTVRDGDLYRRAPGAERAERITFTAARGAGGRLSAPGLLEDGRLTAFLVQGGVRRRVVMLPDGTWMTAWPAGVEPSLVPIPGNAPVLPSIVKRPAEAARPDGGTIGPGAQPTGFLVLYDVARSDDPMIELRSDEIAAVRLLDRSADRVLGELAPEDDGSLFLEVPADLPLGLELLAAGGRVLARTETPFWVRPNERRICFGCHMSPRYAPPNLRPRALYAEARRVPGEAKE